MSKSINVPKLRFKEFSENYKKYKFEDIFSFSTGKNIKQNEASPNFDIPCVRYGELYHMYSEVISKVINKTNLDKSELTFSQGNEILLPSAGEDPLDIGSASALKISNVAIGRTINILRPLSDNIYLPEYVSYLINTKLKKKISTLAKGVSISNVYNSDLKTLTLSLPSKQEQEKIALFLTSIDTKIEQLIKKEELLQQYKKSIMQKIFNQEIRFKADDGSEFCEWKEKTIDKLPILISDGNYGELYPTSDDFKPNGVPFLRANNIKNLKIDTSDTKYISEEQHSTLTAGHLLTNDILITTRGELGNLALIENEHNGSNINAQICLLRITDTSKLNYLYLLYALDYRDSKKQYKAFETGTALKQLPKGNLKKVKLKVPCLEEQTKIANFLSSTDNKIEQVQKQLEQTKKFKKALLQQMFV